MATKKVDALDKLLDMVCDEIEKISAEPALTTNSLTTLDKLIDIKKDILEIKEMENREYSSANINTGSSYRNGYYPSRNYNYNNYSMNNTSGHYRQPYYVQADMWGGFPPMYSRTGSEEEIMNQLREMAESSSPDKKNMIHNFISQLEQM